MRTLHRSIKLFSVGAAMALLALAAGNSEPLGLAQADCTVTVHPGQSIQSAINGAKEGAVICLAAGTWEEDIKIGKSLTLRGAGQEQTILEGLYMFEAVLRIQSDFSIEARIEKLTVAEAQIAPNMEIFGRARVSIADSQISDNNEYPGIVIGDSTQVTVTNSRISNNAQAGILIAGSAQVVITNSRISNNTNGGISIGNSAYAEIQDSLVEGNGDYDFCKRQNWLCNGITVTGESQITIKGSRIIGNMDWGIAAWLQQCGYGNDSFTGKVSIDEKTVIERNNKTGNQNGMANPGNHPWNRPNVPDGQVCLP